MASLSFTVETPIQLGSVNNIDQISQLLSADGGDLVHSKEDRKAAYKQLPIDPADQADATVALRRPGEHRRYDFVARTLIFGSAADVLRYNETSRLLVALADRYPGIPLVGYFDDFSEISRPCLGEASLDTPNRFCYLLGFHLKGGAPDGGASVVFLGIPGIPHAPITVVIC